MSVRRVDNWREIEEIRERSTYHRLDGKSSDFFDSPWCSLLECYPMYLHENPRDQSSVLNTPRRGHKVDFMKLIWRPSRGETYSLM